ncbi:MAG TPA: glycosyltransferase [Candidatus Atribacteria bacterium]|nr:glycosyltransferase [Candidatus Atribacteria bacterium]
MKILYLTSRFPLPCYSGYQLRCMNFIKELSQYHDITLLSFVERTVNARYINELKKYCKEVITVRGATNTISNVIINFFATKPHHVLTHRNKFFEKQLRALISRNRFDVVFHNHIYFAEYIYLLRSSINILDQHAFTPIYWKYIGKYHHNPLMRFFGEINRLKSIVYEKKNISLFDLVISVSKNDKNETQRITGCKNIIIAPNGVDVNYYRKKNDDIKDTNNTILFTGSGAERNINAIYNFYEHVYKPISQKINICFIIAGNIKKTQLKFINFKNKYVILTGPVEDIRPYFNKADVYVAPFTIGGGTKLKILEAMAMEVPIIATKTAIDGIEVHNGKHLTVAHSWREFRESLLELLKNKDLRVFLSKNARSLVKKKYSWKSIVSEVNNILEELYKRHFVCKV